MPSIKSKLELPSEKNAVQIMTPPPPSLHFENAPLLNACPSNSIQINLYRTYKTASYRRRLLGAKLVPPTKLHGNAINQYQIGIFNYSEIEVHTCNWDIITFRRERPSSDQQAFRTPQRVNS